MLRGISQPSVWTSEIITLSHVKIPVPELCQKCIGLQVTVTLIPGLAVLSWGYLGKLFPKRSCPSISLRTWDPGVDKKRPHTNPEELRGGGTVGFRNSETTSDRVRHGRWSHPRPVAWQTSIFTSSVYWLFASKITFLWNARVIFARTQGTTADSRAKDHRTLHSYLLACTPSLCAVKVDC